MVDLYIEGETHTLASMLRERLERNHPDEFVACAQAHPLDDFIRVTAPSVQDVRRALLELIEQVGDARRELESPPTPSEAPAGGTDESAPVPAGRARRARPRGR